jgi:hypothetical protein
MKCSPWSEWRAAQLHIAPFIARKIYVLFVIIRRRERMRAALRHLTAHESRRKISVFRPQSESGRAFAGHTACSIRR